MGNSANRRSPYATKTPEGVLFQMIREEVREIVIRRGSQKCTLPCPSCGQNFDSFFYLRSSRSSVVCLKCLDEKELMRIIADKLIKQLNICP